MERSEALRLLSPLHAEALELSAQGFGPSELAALLDIDGRAVAPLLRIARAKLATLLSLDVELDALDVEGSNRFQHHEEERHETQSDR
jgi:hypothetical protein